MRPRARHPQAASVVFRTEKLLGNTPLLAADRETLFKRYSVRKVPRRFAGMRPLNLRRLQLSLDHFYIASQHAHYAHANLFMMANNRFVNELSTGFEVATDSPIVRKAKFRLLRPTIDDSLNAVRRFIALNIAEPEIVTLHQLLLFSASSKRRARASEARASMQPLVFRQSVRERGDTQPHASETRASSSVTFPLLRASTRRADRQIGRSYFTGAANLALQKSGREFSSVTSFVSAKSM